MPSDTPTAVPTPPTPLLVRERQANNTLNLSRRTIRRAMAAGRFPAAIRIGGCVAWKYADLIAWVDAGCARG